MKTQRISLYIVLLLFIFEFVFQAAYAADEIAVIKNLEDGAWVSISGNSPESFGYVSVQVLKPNAKLPITTEDISYHNQIISKENGEFTFNYKMDPNSVSGVYKVRIRYENGTECNLVMSYYDAEEINQKFDILNTSTDINEIKDIINNFADNFEFDLSIYNSFSNDIKLKTIERFITYRGEGFENKPKAADKFFEASLIQAAVEYTADDFEKLISGGYSERSGLNKTKAYMFFASRLEQEDINKVRQKMAEYDDYIDLEHLKTIFNEEILLQMIAQGKSWYNTKDVIENFASDLGIDLSFYNALSNKNSVCKALDGNQYTKTSFQFAFNKAILDVQDRGKINNKGGGGSPSNRHSSSVSMGYTAEELKETKPILSKTSIRGVFPDVIEKALWANESINVLYNLKIVNGTADGIFEPEKYITREQFVKMIILMLGNPEYIINDIFKDVNKNDWYAKYVCTAKEIGIVNGISDSEFGVGQHITREEMAVILYRAGNLLGYQPGGSKVVFSDEHDISSYAKESIEMLSKGGIINGMTDGSFQPNKKATRAEAACMVYNMINAINN